MSRSTLSTLLLAAALLIAPATAAARPVTGASPTQVGHEPLMNRGMNAAIAVHGDYAYIGSRTDGGHEGVPHGGVMVVDISDPAARALLGPPFDAKPGESSRELRVWKSQDVLIVLNTNCGVGDMLHHCTRPSISNFRVYDISRKNARSPRLLHQFDVRNGLYVLEYKGPHARQIHRMAFLEGSSNQGDALCFEPVGPAGRHCD